MIRPLSCAPPLSLLLALGCTPVRDSAEPLPAFCEDASGGDEWRFEGTGGGSTSGTFEGSLITDAAAEVDDPDYVAYIQYTVENVDVGGTTQQSGNTDNYGYFTSSGAAGTWLFQAGTTVAGQPCNAEMEFEVEVGQNTTICPLLRCTDY